jgi:mannose-6-phosphate isomerase-like protein (cupin superfamily)
MKKPIDINTDFIKNTLLLNHEGDIRLQEIENTESALIEFAKQHSVEPSNRMRTKILERMKTIQHQQKNSSQLDVTNLPLLDENSNWLDWQNAISHIQAPTFDDVYLHPLESNETRDLFIVWVREIVPDEVHHDLIESFLILEGTCECYITKQDGTSRTVRLSEGEFISMQIGESHIIKITSPEPAKAILQWKKLAA